MAVTYCYELLKTAVYTWQEYVMHAEEVMSIVSVENIHFFQIAKKLVVQDGTSTENIPPQPLYFWL